MRNKKQQDSLRAVYYFRLCFALLNILEGYQCFPFLVQIKTIIELQTDNKGFKELVIPEDLHIKFINIVINRIYIQRYTYFNIFNSIERSLG